MHMIAIHVKVEYKIDKICFSQELHLMVSVMVWLLCGGLINILPSFVIYNDHNPLKNAYGVVPYDGLLNISR